MINFVPIFPLNIVVFPGEPLNLHIFEPRYKQLIDECVKEGKTFGIPAVVDKEIEEYGTLIEVTEVYKVYDNGEMDIRTRGVKVFRILEVIKEIPDKLYSGAIVEYPVNAMERGQSTVAENVIGEVERLFALLNATEKLPGNVETMISYQIGHLVGMTRRQEYEMLSIFTEIQRLEYLRRHLNTIIPAVKGLEEIKARIKMNGHFRDLSREE
jgi:Lon protease-like protein